MNIANIFPFRPEPRIPTLVGLLLVAIGLGATIFLVETGSALLSRATGSAAPDEINITNISDTSVSVSWVTHIPTKGNVTYREKTPLGVTRTAWDIRDQNSPVSRYTHFITIADLMPQTVYEFTLISGRQKFTDRLLSSLTTPPSLPPPARLVSPAFGTLVDASGNPITDALVYASFNGSSTLGTIVDPDGSWIIPLGTMRTADGSRYFYPTPQDEERLSFVSRIGSTAVSSDIEHDQPLPPVKMAPANSRTGQISLPVIAQATNFGNITGSASGPFTVYYPEDGVSIASGKPAFKGKGVAGAKVIISLTGPGAPVLGQTVIAPNGTWTWTPPALPPGIYHASIVSFISGNAPVTIFRTFTILKSGSAVLQAATPSGSLATPAPTPAPTPRPSASPLAGSSPGTSPLPSPLPSGSPTGSPESSASPSGSPVPTTGTTTPTLALLLIGALITFAGIISLTRSKSTLDTEQ